MGTVLVSTKLQTPTKKTPNNPKPSLPNHPTSISFFFFGGLSIHLAQAILAHLFSYNMTWAATKKEVERSNFFKEVPKIVRRFWLAFLVSGVLVAGIIVLSTSLVPLQWRIGGDGWAVIFPIA